MRKLASLSLLAATLAFLLAACGTPLAPVSSVDDVHTPSAGPGLSTSALADWSADDDLTVEILGTGLGNSNAGMDNATLVIPNPENVVKIYVQVVTKTGTSGEGTYPDPTDVVIVAKNESDAIMDTKSYPGAVDRVNISPQGGVGAYGYSHETAFDGKVASVEVSITGATDVDYPPPDSPRALIVSVFRDLGNGTASAGMVPNLYVFGNDTFESGEQTIPLPADFAGGDVTVRFAISDLESLQATDFEVNDPRIIHYWAKAGDVEDGSVIDEPNMGADLAIVQLVLPNVPASATEVTAGLYSPPSDPQDFPNGDHGDSVYFNTVSVTVETEEDDGGTEGCTPGYWRQEHHFDSWVDYAPEDLFSDVFARMITVSTGGKNTAANPTLLQAVRAPGGQINALARHAVAALLNASSPDVDYPYSVDDVIAMVQAAIDSGDKDQIEDTKDLLDIANNLGCPLN